MSATAWIVVLVACLMAAWPVSSHAGGKLEEKVYIRIAGAGAQWELSDLEDAFARDRALFEDMGIVADYPEIEPAYGIAVEGGARVSNKWSIGLAYSYERGTFTNSAAGTAIPEGGTVEETTDFTDEFTLSIWEMSANVSFWVPYTPGVYVGVSGGLAGALVEETLTIEVESGGTVEMGSASGKYDKPDPVAGIFMGFQYEFESSPLFYIEVGYRMRNFEDLEGEADGSGEIDLVKPGKRLTDLQEVLVGDVDFSGLYGRIGVGFAFE